ncbi:hypothetical protein BBP40_003502 [Aspergillus hancockii]|nr:hypothetical protein BBP40_003502 [Aspergillus hancockii]
MLCYADPDLVDGGYYALRWSTASHSGIGGGGHMLVKAPNGLFEYVDFRETAPAAAVKDTFNNTTGASIMGGFVSCVPGQLRGLEYLHTRYGSLPWSAVVQPAIQVAREGFPIGEDLMRYMVQATEGDDFLTADPTRALDFAPNGTRLGLGDILTHPHSKLLRRHA